MPERELTDAIPGEPPGHTEVQQLIEAERGQGTQGIKRRWQASDSDKAVLVSDAGGVKISRDAGATAPRQVIVDGTPAGGNLSGTYPNPSLSPAVIASLIPAGTIWAYGGGSAPAGWLLCDGAAVNRQTYQTLFAILSTVYGAGDTLTTFNLPDLRGRFPLGPSGTHGLGTMGGAETAPGPAHTHAGSHSHGLNGHAHGLNGHVHAMAGHQHGSSALTVTGSVGGPTTTPIPVNPVTPGTNVMSDQHGHTSNFDVGGTTDGNSGNTDGSNQATAGPTAPTTDTATDSTAPAAAYAGVTVPTMPPFQTVTFIIRSGI